MNEWKLVIRYDKDNKAYEAMERILSNGIVESIDAKLWELGLRK